MTAISRRSLATRRCVWWREVPPPASILIPTRRRRDYLAVALASAASQAIEHGAELIVVEDDAADPETEALAAQHGARYVAHGETRGLNAARNTAIATARVRSPVLPR